MYKLASPRFLFWTAFVTRLLTPGSRKYGYGLLLGCRSALGFLDGEPFIDLKNFLLDDVRKKNWPIKPGKFFPVCFDSLSQSIGLGRLSREGALDVRESRERRDKIVPK